MEPSRDVQNAFEPRIAVFLCENCIPEPVPWIVHFRPRQLHRLQFRCAANVGAADVREALMDGADGVLILGCLMSDCHSGQGHLDALKMVYDVQVLLKSMGLRQERLRHEWVAPCEVGQMDEVLNGYIEAVREYGPMSAESMRKLEAEA